MKVALHKNGTWVELIEIARHEILRLIEQHPRHTAIFPTCYCEWNGTLALWPTVMYPNDIIIVSRD